MKLRMAISGALIATALASGAATAAGAAATPDTHAHAQEGAAISALKLNAGKTWQTDAPLRKGMEAIRSAVAADKSAIHSGKITPARYAALGATVETQVAFMIQNCKLPAAADAQLHLIIADLASGADAMKGKDSAARRTGAEKVVVALEAYGRHFDHPGWRAA